MIDDKIAHVKALIQKREEIDAELASIFGIAKFPKARPTSQRGCRWQRCCRRDVYDLRGEGTRDRSSD